MNAASERTPLIATVRVRDVRPRYSHHVVRRFCTIASSSILVYFFLVCVVYLLAWPVRHMPDNGHGGWSWPHDKGRSVTHEQLRELMLQTPSSERAETWSRYYTSGPHLAGRNYSQAEWTRQRWEEFGIKSHIVSYETLINYPLDHRLALLDRGEVSYEASLVEDVIPDDPTTALEDGVPTFHGYSASGNVTAPVVYVNYGSYQDFEDLRKAGVRLRGNIAIARYGSIFRGIKVKRAQELGMLGVIIYSDPGDDGDTTEEKGLIAYPDGPARQPSSVQRGSVQFLSVTAGDPTTPGYPSKPGVPRHSVDWALPSIPSIPISYLDAIPILKALNGHGPKAHSINKWWARNVGLGYKGVEYNIGPTPDHVVVNLYNQQNYTITPLWNVIGVINGSIPDEVVIVGNHRDAWIAGGASDPNSGSAIMNEVMRSFGEALRLGWKPLRTIVFASWDGEEYGLLGSTEWVEEYLPWLKATSTAYLNVDVGVKGRRFSVASAPLLDNLIRAATAAVQSPNQTRPGQTVADLWDGRIRTMGSGSDFVAFQYMAGIPSIDLGFAPGEGDPVYPYHSNYDSFHWMKTFCDPGFKYHRTVAQILGLITAQLADEPILSFGATDYAKALDQYVNKVEKKLDEALSSTPLEAEGGLTALAEDAISHLRASTRNHDQGPMQQHPSGSSGRGPASFRESLGRLREAVARLGKRAVRLDKRAADLRERAEESIPWWRWLTRLRLALAIRRVNTRYKFLERSFLHEKGLDGRHLFKHVVFAPGLWTGYAGAVFPGLMESIDTEDWESAERWVGIIEDRLRHAAHRLW